MFSDFTPTFLYPFFLPTSHLHQYEPLSCLSLVSLVSATSPVASWSACWCLKTRVIQVEQEAIVSRIWALGAVAGHRSHEGANAHSALVDWSWLYPPPTTTPPPLSLYLFSPPPANCFYGHLSWLPFLSDQTSPVLSESSCSVAEGVEPINNHLHGGENCSASL